MSMFSEAINNTIVFDTGAIKKALWYFLLLLSLLSCEMKSFSCVLPFIQNGSELSCVESGSFKYAMAVCVHKSFDSGEVWRNYVHSTVMMMMMIIMRQMTIWTRTFQHNAFHPLHIVFHILCIMCPYLFSVIVVIVVTFSGKASCP